jgi:phage shock protein PspC (stress-responsive transcriptional regulator)
MARSFQRIESGKKIAGVCTGLADYFDIDVTLVRVLFIVLALASGGVVAVAYVILWLVAPVAPLPTRGTQQPS